MSERYQSLMEMAGDPMAARRARLRAVERDRLSMGPIIPSLPPRVPQKRFEAGPMMDMRVKFGRSETLDDYKNG